VTCYGEGEFTLFSFSLISVKYHSLVRRFATSGGWFLADTTVESNDSENTGMGVGILFTCNLESEIAGTNSLRLPMVDVASQLPHEN
jgi:hypothetical protein